jgi:hypothetical protein
MMPATTGMKGAGNYDRHSTTQLSTIEALQGWIDDAVASLPLPALARPVTVLDLGSSEGRNAIRLSAAILGGPARDEAKGRGMVAGIMGPSAARNTPSI